MRSPVVAAILICSLVAGCVAGVAGFAVGRASAVGPAATAKSGDVSRELVVAGAPSPGGAPLPAAVLQPSLEESLPAAFGGTATWYCGNGSPCTRGYGPADMVAAIDPTLGIAKGTRLRVHHAGRSVEVVVVDVCQCKGARIIDLTSGAFSRLAPLSRGVIEVTIESVRGVVVRGAPTPPATDWSP
jgi:rare lipoprotein A (peptidoglycan hydrolase)